VSCCGRGGVPTDVLYLVTHPAGVTRIADGGWCQWFAGTARCL